MELADELGYLYIDTGAMYRAVTFYFDFAEVSLDDTTFLEEALDEMSITFVRNPSTGSMETYLNGTNVENEIRSMEVSRMVIRVSQSPEVRAEMVSLQRSFAEENDLVMDGRDIGTVVFPDANLKIFMIADEQIRTQRRFDELKAKGVSLSLDEVLENIRERDKEDTQRKQSPLKASDDAIIIDNTNLNRQQQFDQVMALIGERIFS